MKSTLERAVPVLLCAGVALAAGCAVNPAPVEQISRSSTAIEYAATYRAASAAPHEFEAARDKLGLAKRWMADQDNEPATWLAEQSEVDAQLAAARAQTLQVERDRDRVAGEIRALRIALARTL